MICSRARCIVLILAGTFLTTPLQAQVLNPGKSVIVPTADTLVDIIRATQKRYVRESWGERAFECFTDSDLQKFYADRIPDKIARELASDQRFQALSRTIRALPVGQQDELLARAASTYKPTWAQIGKIDRSGQTDAGQQAERDIAKRIVDVVREAPAGPYAVELTWLERREGVGNRRHQQLEDAMTLVKGTAVTAERNDWR